MKHHIKLSMAAIFTLAVAVLPLTAQATHSWSGYHWARTSNPLSLQLGSNLTSSWQPYLVTTSSDWNQSAALATSVITGTKNPYSCKPTTGRVEVCNAPYGKNGWLGLAQIWVSNSHITQGTVKMNDTYMSHAPYITAAEKNHVMCQEVGHTLGLAHQDESGASLKTCMDYSQSLDSQHPNQHDFDELAIIYAHFDSPSTPTKLPAAPLYNRPDQKDWGHLVYLSATGRAEVYEHDLGNNQKLITFVTKSP